MTDGEHADSLRRWLADDLFVLNTVFLIAASSLAIVLTSCLWHHIHPEPHSIDQQHPNDASSILAALSFFRVSTARTVSSTSQQQSLPTPSPEQQERKSTRSKERRRRGKDPFRDLLKGGKKSKALLKAIKATDLDQPPLSADMLSTSAAPGNDTASSTSRSQSPEPARDLLELDHCASRSDGESCDSDSGGSSCNISPTSSATLTGDITDRCSPDTCSRVDDIRSHLIRPDSMTSADTQLNASSASTVTGHASEDAPSSPPVSTACTDVCTPQPRNSRAVSVGESCTQLVRARTRLRLSRMEPVVKSQLLLSSAPMSRDGVASPSPPIHLDVPCPSVSIIPSPHTTGGTEPSTSTHIRGSASASRSLSLPKDLGQGECNTQPLDQGATNAQVQLASLHSALEAARLREEQLRIEAERTSKERDELRWRWNEDADLWRRREAELRAHIHHLMQQLQAYVTVASFQAQQSPNSSFPPPTSPHVHSSPRLHHHPLVSFPLPPVIQTQNSASAPAHVQALLACAPMLTSHPPGFAVPPSASLYSGTDSGVSGLLRPGVGLCVPKRDPRHGGQWTPDSSPSGSMSRGRRRERHAEKVGSASDESSLGDWDGTEDGSGDEGPGDEEEDVFRNNVLADAILKRPESIRGLSGSVGRRSGMGREVGKSMDALKDPVEEHGFVPALADTPAVRTAADTLER